MGPRIHVEPTNNLGLMSYHFVLKVRGIVYLKQVLKKKASKDPQVMEIEMMRAYVRSLTVVVRSQTTFHQMMSSFCIVELYKSDRCKWSLGCSR